MNYKDTIGDEDYLKPYIYILLALLISLGQVRAQVRFSADFESGSIGSSELLEQQSDSLGHLCYAITTKKDPENPALAPFTPSDRWFYFKMQGVKDREITLEISNNDSKRSLYSYDNINFHRFTSQEVPEDNGAITKKYSCDSVFIAYFIPYTTTRADEKLSRWSQSPYVRHFSIGKSTEGRDMDMIVATKDNHEGLTPDKFGKYHPTHSDLLKKVIYIHGRIHPSESPASWHLEAFVDRLIANNQDLLDDAIFYILPITNPDGVEGGYSRSNSIGIDLEGNFADSQKIVAAEVACIKRFLTSLKAGGLEPKLSLNMHAQSSPKISYWLHSASSTKREYNRRLRLMAHLTASDNRHFSPEQADETSLKGRYLEGWIRKHFHGRCIALTHELPYSYYNSEPNGEWVDKENLAEQSLNTLNAICEILNIKRKEQTRCSEPERYRGTKRRRDNTPYLGRGYLTAKRAGVRVPFTTELKRGSYNVMMWSAERGWHLAGYHIQQYDGEARFYYKCKTVGQIVDDVVFIKCDSWMAPS